MPNNNKKRGDALEYECRDCHHAAGVPNERARASDGRAIGEVKEVDNRTELPGLKVRYQCKRVKKLAARYEIPPGVEAVWFREDGSRDPKNVKVLVSADLWLRLLKAYSDHGPTESA